MVLTGDNVALTLSVILGSIIQLAEAKAEKVPNTFFSISTSLFALCFLVIAVNSNNVEKNVTGDLDLVVTCTNLGLFLIRAFVVDR